MVLLEVCTILSEFLDALVMTLGFEPGPLIRAAASYSLKPRASIVVLTPSFKDDRSERAYLELKKVCDILFKDVEISFQRIEVNLSDFPTTVKQIRELLMGFADKRVAICLSGGMRALCIATYTAYLTTEWRYPPIIEVHLEGRAERILVPPLHEVLKLSVTEEKLVILRLLSKYGSLSMGDIASLMQKDRSTVYRHASSLVRMGLLNQRGKFYELTDLGRMLA